MHLSDRLQAFVTLGKRLQQLPKDQLQAIAQKALHENGWFTPESVELAFRSIGLLMDEARLSGWIARYNPEPASMKTVGVAMAGNIPLVGFHDFAVVLLSGNKLRYKPSSRDSVLLDLVQQLLLEIEPRFADRIAVSDHLRGVDAIIATGSDNTSRYFDYYFRNIPHIIRKNRVSCAVVQGDEPPSEIILLGRDIFDYYGLGCRNVSTVYLPRELDLKTFVAPLELFKGVMENHKYSNNYTYQKSLALLNQEAFLDTGFLLVKNSDAMVSPVATLHYTYYDDLESLRTQIAQNQAKLQVIVSARGWFNGSIPFGAAQLPQIDEYADGIDTMKFLMTLK